MHIPSVSGIWAALQTLSALPSVCAICHGWPADRLCADCVARFAAIKPRCQTCAAVVDKGVAQCGACARDGSPLRACCAALCYGYPWAAIIHAFKFHGDAAWAAPLAALMRQSPQAIEILQSADALLPVPLGPERLRQRGFNQSLLLASCLTRAFHPGRQVWADGLVRLHEGAAQRTLTRAQRLVHLRQSYAVHPLHAPRLRGKNLVLIDDVMTTGATLQACAQALGQAGAACVQALVLARTPAP